MTKKRDGGRVKEPRKLVPVRLINFLDGSAQLDGVWYGEEPPRGKPRFWWRKYFDGRKK